MHLFQPSILLLIVVSSLTILPKAWPSEGGLPQQSLFEKVFGNLVILDPKMVQQVVSGIPGERHYVDANQDGKPEEVWFIDTDSRHPESMRPLLVRALDEDRDLAFGGEPDRDSDLYIADWNADGTVDAVLDYTDKDGDNDVDEMALYYYDESGSRFGEPVLRCWWGRDNGDDNLLWYDIGYTYRQDLCQLKSHFGGNETFAYFALTMGGEEWVPNFENPFLFYDLDFDGVSEEVLRIDGDGTKINNIRHSFDADNDATPAKPRDYDVSLTAYAPDGLSFDESLGERITLRGIETGPILTYRTCPAFVAPIVWKRSLFTWDENDHNVDGQQQFDGEERWEGVIAHGNPDFRQVGGPTCGPYNKRYELDLAPSAPTACYYHPADHRIHLRGADKAWMEVDYDMDLKVDMRYEMSDTDGDGAIDTWKVDLDADGTIDETWEAKGVSVTPVGWNWAELNAAITPVLKDTPSQIFALNEDLERGIIKVTGKSPDHRLGRLIHSGFQSENISPALARKLVNSKESLRFYFDLWKDLLIHQLRQVFPEEGFWRDFDQARSQGDYPRMAELVSQKFPKPGWTRPFWNWQRDQMSTWTPKRATWAEDWVPPNIGWESDKIAYRAYWGQFDFFGKKVPDPIYPTIGATSYHEETGWGIDALQVGETCGCGGLTLYLDGEPIPVRSPGGKGPWSFEKRLVSEQNDHVVIEMTARGTEPETAPYTIRFHCSAIEGRQDSPVEVLIEGGHPGTPLQVGIGLVKLPHENVLLDTSAGVMGAWGSQDRAIGIVGLGLVYPPEKFVRFADLSKENQVVLSAETGHALVYHIQCDWLKGRRFNCCPTPASWLEELRKLAAEEKPR
jgi:hypothetical protein